MRKSLWFFLLFLVVLNVAVFQFAQSRYFSAQLSQLVNSKLDQKLEANFEIAKINLDFMPLQLRLEGILLENENINFHAKTVQLSLDWTKTLHRGVVVSSINLKDGKLTLKSMDSNESENQEFELQKLLDKYHQKSPINIEKFTLQDIELVSPKANGLIQQLQGELNKESVLLQGSIANIEGKFSQKELFLDKVDAKAKLTDNELQITSLTAYQKSSSLELKGVVSDYLAKNTLKMNLEYALKTQLPLIDDYFKLPSKFYLSAGDLTVDGSLRGKLDKFLARGVFKLQDFETAFADGDILKAEFSLNNERISIKELFLKHGQGELNMADPFVLYSLSKSEFLPNPIVGNFKNFSLSNGLKFVKGLDSLDGNIDGKVKFVLNTKSFHFLVPETVKVSPLTLTINQNKILNIPSLMLQEASFNVLPDKFTMLARAATENSKLNVAGEVADEKLEFKTFNDSFLALDELGAVAGLELQGKGPVQIKVLNDNMTIETKLDKFSVAGIYQKSLDTKLKIDFEKRLLEFPRVSSIIGTTQTNAQGFIDLDSDTIKFTVRHEKLRYSDLIRALQIKDPLRNELYGSFETAYKISGGLSLRELEVKGAFFGEGINLYEESIDSLKTNFELKKQRLSFSELILRKSEGSIQGSGFYDLESGTVGADLKLDNLSLQGINLVSQLPLGINGQLNGKVNLELFGESDRLQSDLQISDTRIPGKSLGDSQISLKIENKLFNVDANLIGEKVLLRGGIALDQQNLSGISLDFKVDDLRDIIGTSDLIDLNEANIKGDLFAKANFVFDTKDYSIVNGNLNIKKFSFKKDLIDIDYENPEVSEILIRNKEILNWKIYLRGRNAYFVSQARGSFERQIGLETNFKVDASIFEIFNKVISKANGAVYGTYSVKDLSELSSQKLVLKSSDISMALKDAPANLEDLNFLLRADIFGIDIEKFTARLGQGTFEMLGGIDLRQVIPKVDLGFKFNDTSLNLLNKSTLVFSGQGSLKGERLPYELSANMYLQRFSLLNEFTELISSKGSLDNKIKYLPKTHSRGRKKYLNLDISVKTVNALNIKNSMASMALLGDVDITGSENRLRADGSVYLAPGSNKLFFKGNEFRLNKATARFLPTRELTNPELDIEIQSKIEQYNIMANVLGPVEDFRLELESEPHLEKSDILSLVAFGYTENTSSALTPEQKNLMTQAGIGALLFEQFKINETLKKELGIQFQLGTEISQSDESLLNPRAAGSSSTQRVNSATKIEVKKELLPQVDLSVSSTIGSGVSQRQRMNLNYSVSDKISVEGVYENRTDTQGQIQRQGTSMGFDFNMKWTFK